MISEYQDICCACTAWIHEAGAIALERFGHASATRKADRSIVTDVDHAVQAHLLGRIASAYPDHGVISEETQRAPGRHAPLDQARRVWVVDPIDGTRSYARSFPGFCISVGLLEDGVPVVGVIHSPLTHQTYWAVTGGGAWLGERRLQVCDPGLTGDTLLAIPSSRRGGPMPSAVHGWLDRMVVRNLGSTALHLALLAAGSLDAVFADECRLWDITAGELILREAGGQLVSLTGRPYFPMQPSAYAGQETPFMAAGPQTLAALLREFHA